jgi:DNA-binding transcriptional LysR family regulator
MLDPRRLLTFREVARQGSFSKAANALALTQPAVSQQVGALERELGAKLLTRGRGGTTVTPAGELLLAHAEAVAARLELADTQMEEMASDQKLSLRVGSFPSALATIVPVAVAALRRRLPELEVAIEEAPTAELEQAVTAGDLHAVLGFQDAGLPRREFPGLRRMDIAEEPFVAVLPADHRLAKRKRVTLEDLAGEAWLAPSRSGIIVRACQAAGFEPDIAIVTRDPLASAAMTAAGLAVSITPRLSERMKLPGVVHRPLQGAPRRTLYVLLPDKGAHPLADDLVRELAAAAR